MDILELQYEMLSRLDSQRSSLNLNDFQLETGESAADIEAAARALWTHEPHFVRALSYDIVCITDAGRLELARLKQEREQKANEAQAVANQIAEMAKAKAKKADIKSWVSIGIAFLSLVAEVLIHHAELLSLFVQSTT